MYYVPRKTSLTLRSIAKTHIVPAVVVFGAFTTLTVWSWYQARQSLHQETRQRLAQDAERTTLAINQALKAHEDTLRTGVSLFAGTDDNVTADDWKNFVNVLDLPDRYPGVQSIGYSEIITPDELSAHVLATRKALNDPRYNVYPSGKRRLYSSVIYLEPSTQTNSNIIGYDMLSEAHRQDAMQTAALTRQTSMTEPVQLIQSPTGENSLGFLMYTPYFAHTSSTRPKGYVYAPFRGQTFFGQIIAPSNNGISYKVSAAMDTSEPKSLYVGPGYEEATHTYGAEMTTRTIDSYRQGWKLYAVIDPKIALSFRERSRPINVLWGGMLFSTFVAGFIYLLLLNRTRHLSERESEEIQSAKDELLALASHQLRTPATGVKQYLGILREGMAGQLNVEQTEVLEKAYASNERQLGTINEMLVVAKADNGHLDIQMQAVDINHLVNEIVDEARDYADKRSHHLNVYLSKQPMYIMGDREYLRMAIENVISNANKYTPDGGTVTITLLKKKGNVEVIIRDNGVGVAKQDFHMLFEKFSRIPNKLTRQVGGSGIGLYLAKKIIHQHNGTIGFESTHGEGSVCSIRLPIMQHDNKPEA